MGKYTLGVGIITILALVGGLGYNINHDLNWPVIVIGVIVGIALIAKGMSDEGMDETEGAVTAAVFVSWGGGIGLYQAIFGTDSWLWLVAWIGISIALTVWMRKLNA